MIASMSKALGEIRQKNSREGREVYQYANTALKIYPRIERDNVEIHIAFGTTHAAFAVSSARCT